MGQEILGGEPCLGCPHHTGSVMIWPVLAAHRGLGRRHSCRADPERPHRARPHGDRLRDRRRRSSAEASGLIAAAPLHVHGADALSHEARHVRHDRRVLHRRLLLHVRRLREGRGAVAPESRRSFSARRPCFSPRSRSTFFPCSCRRSCCTFCSRMESSGPRSSASFRSSFSAPSIWDSTGTRPAPRCSGRSRRTRTSRCRSRPCSTGRSAGSRSCFCWPFSAPSTRGTARTAIVLIALSSPIIILHLVTRAEQSVNKNMIFALIFLAPAASLGVDHMVKIFSFGAKSRIVRGFFTVSILVIFWAYGLFNLRWLERQYPDVTPVIEFFETKGFDGMTVAFNGWDGVIYDYVLEDRYPNARFLNFVRDPENGFAEAGVRRAGRFRRVRGSCSTARCLPAACSAAYFEDDFRLLRISRSNTHGERRTP